VAATTGTGFSASVLSAYVANLESVLDADANRRITRAAGFAAKDAGLEAAADKLGGDRAMSGYKNGNIKLGIGYDTASWRVDLFHRPKGLWLLADQGRKRSGWIYPRPARGRGKTVAPTPGRAVLTPFGPRAASSFGPSRGTGVFKLAAARERDAAPKAAWRQLQTEFRRITRG
jgi:hypothetical protein